MDYWAADGMDFPPSSRGHKAFLKALKIDPSKRFCRMLDEMFATSLK